MWAPHTENTNLPKISYYFSSGKTEKKLPLILASLSLLITEVMVHEL